MKSRVKRRFSTVAGQMSAAQLLDHAAVDLINEFEAD